MLPTIRQVVSTIILHQLLLATMASILLACSTRRDLVANAPADVGSWPKDKPRPDGTVTEGADRAAQQARIEQITPDERLDAPPPLDLPSNPAPPAATPEQGTPVTGAVAPPPALDSNHTPFHINAFADAGVTAGAMVLVGVPRLLAKETVRPWCQLDCNPEDVNAMDRTVIGHNSEVALQISNAGFYTSMGLPFLLSGIDLLSSQPSDGLAGTAADTLVLLETLSITLTANNLLSFVVRRPRPRTYDTNLSDEERMDPNNVFSFPSGHTSASFAMATAYSRIYMLRHPDSPGVIPVWLGTYSLAVMTAVGRPFAGDHFWSDVMVGAVTGVGLGLLIPWIHLPDSEGNVVNGRNPKQRGTSMSFVPFPLENGGGVMMSIL